MSEHEHDWYDVDVILTWMYDFDNVQRCSLCRLFRGTHKRKGDEVIGK